MRIQDVSREMIRFSANKMLCVMNQVQKATHLAACKFFDCSSMSYQSFKSGNFPQSTHLIPVLGPAFVEEIENSIKEEKNVDISLVQEFSKMKEDKISGAMIQLVVLSFLFPLLPFSLLKVAGLIVAAFAVKTICDVALNKKKSIALPQVRDFIFKFCLSGRMSALSSFVTAAVTG